LARRLLGRPAQDDPALTRVLLERSFREFGADGRNGGAVVPAIWRVHELLDLGGQAEPDCGSVMEWLLALQGKPGAFSQGCSRIRHSHRVCEHFISGFFAPAPPEQRVAPVMLPNGKVFRAEPAARFAISCLALRAVLRSRWSGRASVQRHLASLHQLQEQWTNWNSYFSSDAIVAGIHTLALGFPSDRQIRTGLSNLIVRQQAADGTWPTADLFHTLETLLALGTAEAQASVRRALPALLSRQRIDGTFGSTAQQERAWIGLRSLIWAEQEG
jgi:hypothetical protein